MLDTASSLITISEGMPSRIEAVKSGALSFFRSSSTITSRAICPRLEARSSIRVKPALHVRNPAFEPQYQGLVAQGRADDGHDDFMQVCEPLNGIGEGLLVDLGILRLDAVADGAVGTRVGLPWGS